MDSKKWTLLLLCDGRLGFLQNSYLPFLKSYFQSGLILVNFSPCVRQRLTLLILSVIFDPETNLRRTKSKYYRHSSPSSDERKERTDNV